MNKSEKNKNLIHIRQLIRIFMGKNIISLHVSLIHVQLYAKYILNLAQLV